jgi:hypothetical protein
MRRLSVRRLTRRSLERCGGLGARARGDFLVQVSQESNDGHRRPRSAGWPEESYPRLGKRRCQGASGRRLHRRALVTAKLGALLDRRSPRSAPCEPGYLSAVAIERNDTSRCSSRTRVEAPPTPGGTRLARRLGVPALSLIRRMPSANAPTIAQVTRLHQADPRLCEQVVQSGPARKDGQAERYLAANRRNRPVLPSRLQRRTRLTTPRG